MDIISALMGYTQTIQNSQADTVMPGAFVVVHFHGRGGVNECPTCEIDVLTGTRYINIRPLRGFPIRLRLGVDGGQRFWKGYVTRVILIGTTGDLNRYRITTEAPLAFLRRRRNSLDFAGKDVLDISEQVFGDHPEASLRTEARQSLRTFPLRDQFRKLDCDFVLRQLSEKGLNFRVAHAQDTSGDGKKPLNIWVRVAERAAGPNYGHVYFSGPTKSLPNSTDRVEYVGQIAKDFTRLMRSRKAYMEDEIKKIAGWKMHKRYRFGVTLLSAAALLLPCCQSHGKSMAAIRFDLGKNIADVAKDSGASSFAIRDVDGFISYTLVGLPDKTAVLYDRSGFEINWAPVFALTLYADHHRSSHDLVETVDMQLGNRAFNSLEASKTFVENTIAQFQRGGWKRFIPESCPRVTGRSSLLNLQGDLDIQRGCPLDPSYKLSMDEWRHMMVTTQHYQWLGDNVLAELTFSYHPGDTGSPATFDVGLSFESKAAKDATDEKNLSDKLKQGDEKRWNSTAKYRAEMTRFAELNKLLEAAAEKRGNSVVSR